MDKFVLESDMKSEIARLEERIKAIEEALREEGTEHGVEKDSTRR